MLLLGCALAAWLIVVCVYVLLRLRVTPLCEDEFSDPSWRLQPLKLSALEYVDFAWMRARFGHLEVFAAESSRVRDDTTDMSDGGLHEESQLLATFLDEIESGDTGLRHNYLKLVDPLHHLRFNTGPINGLEQLMPFGESVVNALRASLHAKGIDAPANVTYSLWLGGRGSTTAMHVDDQSFNVLLVLRGRKRVVTVDGAEIPRAKDGDELRVPELVRPLHQGRRCGDADLYGRAALAIAWVLSLFVFLFCCLLFQQATAATALVTGGRLGRVGCFIRSLRNLIELLQQRGRIARLCI